MSYIQFEKTLMTNLEEALPKEILRSNRSGAYSCSTIVDCNTRKYHGLLVVPIPKLSEENYVLLSSLDETVVQHGAEFNLGLHKYQGNNYSPNGHKYIREFNCDQVPTTIYRVGGVILKKEKVFQHFENRIIIRYTLLDAHSETTLKLRPFLAFRCVREYTHENGRVNKDYQEVSNGIKTCMYEGYPDLYMQLNKKNNFVFQPDWYRGVEYPKELERGYAFNEDLYVPGYFEFKIKKGESVVFAAGLSEVKTTQLKQMADYEVNIRTPRDNFYHCLVNSAHQFNYFENGENYILACYPWFKCRARDMMIALPGLTLANGEVEQFEACMKTMEKAINDFIAGKPLSVKVHEMQHPDVLLWTVWCIQQYGKMVSMEKCVEKYAALLKVIMDYLRAGKHPNLKIRENGLLYSEGKDTPITWMNSTANGRPIVPRSGYIVEFNALWYNALKFAEEICATGAWKKDKPDTYAEQALKVESSFKNIFLNEHGYLFDYVDETNTSPDWSVRPNMIFAIAFDYSPLSLPEKKRIFDICTKELLTPKGLRSLSPKSGGYNPMYVGPQIQRDYAYHQGTAWPWLGGFYMEACLRLYKQSRVSFIERVLVGFEEEMFSHCVGAIPELFDGNPPFHARGAISFAMNVAEILRVVKLVEKYII